MTATACSAAWATCWPTRGSGCCSWTSRSRGGCGCSAARRLEEPRGEFEGEQLVVRVQAEQIFPNCPRYIHRMTMVRALGLCPVPGARAARARLEEELPGRAAGKGQNGRLTTRRQSTSSFIYSGLEYHAVAAQRP